MSLFSIESTETYLPDEQGVLFEGKLRSGYRNIELEDYDSAEENFREALALDPEHVGALLSLAMCLAEGFRRYLSAEKIARKAMLIDPENPECYFTLGKINQMGARRERARRYYQQAWRLAPGEDRFKNAYQALCLRKGGLTRLFRFFQISSWQTWWSGRRMQDSRSRPAR